MKLTNHILPIMLTLMMLCGVTIAQAVERSTDGFNLVPSPIAEPLSLHARQYT